MYEFENNYENCEFCYQSYVEYDTGYSEYSCYCSKTSVCLNVALFPLRQYRTEK